MVTTFSYFPWETLIPEKWYLPGGRAGARGAIVFRNQGFFYENFQDPIDSASPIESCPGFIHRPGVPCGSCPFLRSRIFHPILKKFSRYMRVINHSLFGAVSCPWGKPDPSHQYRWSSHTPFLPRTLIPLEVLLLCNRGSVRTWKDPIVGTAPHPERSARVQENHFPALQNETVTIQPR